MVSALRQRASRQADPSAVAGGGSPPVVNDAVDTAVQARTRAAVPQRRRGEKLSRFARRFGLALSIAAGMVASAIGGALAAKSRPVPSTMLAAPAPAPAASAPAPAHLAATVGAAASAAAPAAEAHAPEATDPRQASAANSAASSAGHGAATEPHGEAPTSGAEPDAPPMAHAPSTAPVVAAPPAPTLAEDLTFGLDLNGDGIPDALERYVRKTIATPATRVAARHYYRVALPLATRSQQGDSIAHADKLAVFRAAECYLLTAADDDVPDPPNLNDRAILIGVAAADRMQALAEALAGFDYRLAGAKRQACG